MRNVVLYIAMSLDGYIADSEGTVNWIKGRDEAVELQDTYSPFFATVDTVVMGRRTYDQITTELSPGAWPYSGAKTFVITHHPENTDRTDIVLTDLNPCKLIEKLKQKSGKDIWVCGGAEIVNRLLT